MELVADTDVALPVDVVDVIHGVHGGPSGPSGFFLGESPELATKTELVTAADMDMQLVAPVAIEASSLIQLVDVDEDWQSGYTYV